MTDKQINNMYGYARVSTKNQNLDRQVDALVKEGVPIENIFQEKLTGTNMKRPELNKLMETVEKDDLVVFADLTRVSRSTVDLIKVMEGFGEKGVHVKSIKESWLDTTSAMGTFMFTIMAGMAQFERDQTSERTIEGLESAKSRGRYGGRPKRNGDNVQYAIDMFKEGETSIAEICRRTNVSRPTLYRRLKELGLK